VDFPAVVITIFVLGMAAGISAVILLILAMAAYIKCTDTDDAFR
jgi:hypothetical protein